MRPSSRKRKFNSLTSEGDSAHSDFVPPSKRIKVIHSTETNQNTRNRNYNTDMQVQRRSKTRNKKKKLRISAFKVQPKVKQSYEKDTVDKLMKAVQDIHAKRAAQCSFEELYKACQSLCTLKKGNAIYDRLYPLCDDHIQSMIKQRINKNESHSNTYLLPVKKIWTDHREEMHAIRQVFLVLDRTFIRSETDIKSLWLMGISLLKKHILQNPENKEMSAHIITHLLRLIESERNGEEIDQSLLKSVVVMIAHLNIYKSIFEKELIVQSNEYYFMEGNKLIQDLDIPDYLNHVMRRLDEEHNRVITYLNSQTQRHLSIAIEQQMISKHVEKILNKGFVHMMDANRCDDLRHLYALFSSVNQLNSLKDHFLEYSKMRGLQIVNHDLTGKNDKNKNKKSKNKAVIEIGIKKEDKEMIPKLLTFKKKLDNVIALSFQKDHEFKGIIRKSWEYFINERQNKPAELMAKFIDHQLQFGARGTSEQELEDSLDRVMDIFRFVNGKDVFQAFYKKDLAKRLLLNTSASEDAEKNMIARIRKECGQSFATNLENMFKDVDISNDLNEKFLSSLAKLRANNEGECANNVDFEIQVLTSGCWPSYDTGMVTLPPQVSSYLNEYKTFYCAINSGRKLSWTVSLSHCVMAANFPAGRKELVLSAFQACVLLMFNSKNKYKFSDICSSTKINKKELTKTMLSLVKAGILKKRTKGMECGENEEFKLNGKYSNKLRRVKINQIQIIETKEELKKTSHKIYKDRQYQIDACVVRIMKARKELIHQQLMAECLKQLRFDAEPRMIKQRIEKLIDCEYIERDSKNNSLYHYKA